QGRYSGLVSVCRFLGALTRLSTALSVAPRRASEAKCDGPEWEVPSAPCEVAKTRSQSRGMAQAIGLIDGASPRWLAPGRLPFPPPAPLVSSARRAAPEGP